MIQDRFEVMSFECRGARTTFSVSCIRHLFYVDKNSQQWVQYARIHILVFCILHTYILHYTRNTNNPNTIYLFTVDRYVTILPKTILWEDWCTWYLPNVHASKLLCTSTYWHTMPYAYCTPVGKCRQSSIRVINNSIQTREPLRRPPIYRYT